MKKEKENEFHITISSIGTSKLWGGCEKQKSKSALYIALNTCFLMAKIFVGKEKKGVFLYELAVFILANLDGINYNELEEDVEEYKEHKPEDFYVLKKE